MRSKWSCESGRLRVEVEQQIDVPLVEPPVPVLSAYAAASLAPPS